MDLKAIIKSAGADKPKQTRPNDSRWQHNAIQFRRKGSNEKWMFSSEQPEEWDFVRGKEMVRDLNEMNEDKEHPLEYRLVSINEVI